MDLKNGGKVTSLNTSIFSSVNQKCGRMYVWHSFTSVPSSFLINFYTKSRQFGGQLLGSFFFFFFKWVFHTLFIYSLKFNLLIWCLLPDFRQQEAFNLDHFYRDSLPASFARCFFRAILFSFNHDVLSNKWDVMQLICVYLLQPSVSSDQQMNRWKWIPISQLSLMVYVFGILHMILEEKRKTYRKNNL